MVACQNDTAVPVTYEFTCCIATERFVNADSIYTEKSFINVATALITHVSCYVYRHHIIQVN